jgi:hypothetical protein
MYQGKFVFAQIMDRVPWRRFAEQLKNLELEQELFDRFFV